MARSRLRSSLAPLVGKLIMPSKPVSRKALTRRRRSRNVGSWASPPPMIGVWVTTLAISSYIASVDGLA